MILHRFMSKREYEALMAGKKLVNTVDHGAQGERSSSIGFCFFPEEPSEAIHWLSFIVDADYCVTMEIPGHLITSSKGRYRDVEKDNGSLLSEPPMLWRTEYCLTEYSLQQVHVLHVTEEYKMYGRFPENASFWERIERCRLIGEMENKRRKNSNGHDV